MRNGVETTGEGVDALEGEGGAAPAGGAAKVNFDPALA